MNSGSGKDSVPASSHLGAFPKDEGMTVGEHVLRRVLLEHHSLREIPENLSGSGTEKEALRKPCCSSSEFYSSTILHAPGTVGGLQARDDQPSGERQAAAVQKQEFASAPEKRERRGKLSVLCVR